MELSESGKRYLRDNIEKLLSNNNGKKTHIDKDVLEALIFDTQERQLIPTGQKVKVKFIVWSGDFLSKIDLSKVNFDDVIWENPKNASPKYFIDKASICDVDQINLRNTNAQIDFSKSFLPKLGYCICISNCNFSGTDLSNNVINRGCLINNCDLSYTGINLSLQGAMLEKCDLTGIDLSKNTIDESYFQRGNKNGYVYNCKLINTGLNIKKHQIPEKIRTLHFDPKEWGKALSNNRAAITEYRDYEQILKQQDELRRAIKNGLLDGCNIDGYPINGSNIANKPIPILEAVKSSPQQRKSAENDIIQRILKEIKNQVGQGKSDENAITPTAIEETRRQIR